jgi:DNA-binding response OmpR family regulator
VTLQGVGVVRILVVEDNPADVFLIRQALVGKPVQFRVHVAEDGEKAIQFIGAFESDESAAPLDLIVLDLNLPRVSGLEVLQRVRSSEKCALTKIVVLSSSDSTADRAASAQLGAIRYFRKPADLDEFLKIGDLLVELLDPDLQ